MLTPRTLANRLQLFRHGVFWAAGWVKWRDERKKRKNDKFMRAHQLAATTWPRDVQGRSPWKNSAARSPAVHAGRTVGTKNAPGSTRGGPCRARPRTGLVCGFLGPRARNSAYQTSPGPGPARAPHWYYLACFRSVHRHATQGQSRCARFWTRAILGTISRSVRKSHRQAGTK